ncbi:MAG: hypothetical protein IKW51_08460 [Bacteroidales bacterium]|nr:hypothetical protein [Bacteroidales bacterium]
MYRIYDNQTKKFLYNNIYIYPNGDVFISKKTLFGEKLELMSDRRYIKHRSIGLRDGNHVEIYEGDICKIESTNVTGVITYIAEQASYCLLDKKNYKYYHLSEARCKQLKVIGNVFTVELPF